jgi:tRNA-dihydrouridine synthase 1
LNLGCPQHIARRGRYGAFLMEDWELIAKLVRTLHEGLDIPVTCKIRVFPDLAKTIAYAKMIEASGCQMLTVHGRTIKQKGQLTGIADWEAIKAVKEAVSIPVVANGNILYEADVDECIRQTGVDGVMSAEANLTNPTLFSKEGQHHVWKITEEYFEIVKVPTLRFFVCAPSFVCVTAHPAHTRTVHAGPS